MRFDLNEDQTTFSTFLEQMLSSPDTEFRTVEGWGRYDYGDTLDVQLEENGFFDAAKEPDLGPVAAAMMVNQVAQSPVCVECAASALIRPFLGDDLPRPLAVVMDDAPGPVRFLPKARGIVSISGGRVRYATVPQGSAQGVDSLYAYPMGTVEMADLDWEDTGTDPAALRTLWQVAVAAELTGVLKAGTNAVIEHVSERRQFGQPIGAFQGVQHRLANAAVEIEGARWLMLRAAHSRTDADATCALGYAQGMATRIGYDLHQFMGAMGLTLEHPLHRWTYRARLLRAELGGTGAAYQAYAQDRWGAA